MSSDPRRHGATRDVIDSDANVGEDSGLAGGMGVSSERVGRVRGSAEPATHGAESTQSPPVPDPPPEQSADPRTGPEPHPANDLPPHRFDPSTAPGHSHG